jgi:hypothetical protein
MSSEEQILVLQVYERLGSTSFWEPKDFTLTKLSLDNPPKRHCIRPRASELENRRCIEVTAEPSHVDDFAEVVSDCLLLADATFSKLFPKLGQIAGVTAIQHPG